MSRRDGRPGFFSRENMREKNAGATYSEKALLAKQVTTAEALLAEQQETNRLLGDLLAAMGGARAAYTPGAAQVAQGLPLAPHTMGRPQGR